MEPIRLIIEQNQGRFTVDFTPVADLLLQFQQEGNTNLAEILKEIYSDTTGKYAEIIARLNRLDTNVHEIIAQNDIYHTSELSAINANTLRNEALNSERVTEIEHLTWNQKINLGISLIALAAATISLISQSL